MTISEQPQTTWWGRFSLSEMEGGRWQIGPLSFWAYHDELEWRIYRTENPDADAMATVPLPEAEMNQFLEHEGQNIHTDRFICRESEQFIHIMPMLADQPIVVRPANPLFIMPGQDVTLFVSSPIWISIAIGETPMKVLDIPLISVSKTWFGPNNIEGEICYALQTLARLQITPSPSLSHRAVTLIRLKNQSNAALPLERLKLPVQHLSLFHTEGIFRTQSVSIHWNEEGTMDEMIIHKGPLPEGNVPPLLTGPRQRPGKSLAGLFTSILKP